MKLAAKLMVLYLAIVVLMTAAGSYFTVQRRFERLQLSQEQLARRAAEAADKKLAAAWQRSGAEGLTVEMQEIGAADSRSGVRWVWFEQVERSSEKPGSPVVEHVNFHGLQTCSMTITDEHGRRQLRTYHTINLGHGPRGGLELSTPLEPHDASTRDTIMAALLTLGGAALGSVVLVYVAGVYWVARPLDQLIAKTERIATGDFGDPLPIRGKDELSQLAHALNDMSARLATQQQRIQAETAARLTTLEQLRHADRLKTVGRLAAGLAHELGTPLNVISGRAGLISSGRLSSEEVTSSAKTIKAEADRVTTIIRQLLDFARPGKSQRSPVEINELLQHTVALIEPLAEKRGVRLISPSSPDVSVSADRGQLQQVLTNILVNAVQSMPEGGEVTATVTECDARPPVAEPSATKRCVAIAIRDQGPGISPEQREQIFEPFFTTKEVGEGTGLGLSIAYGIVQEHGGWIDVESTPGQGSLFTVYLPQE